MNTSAAMVAGSRTRLDACCPRGRCCAPRSCGCGPRVQDPATYPRPRGALRGPAANGGRRPERAGGALRGVARPGGAHRGRGCPHPRTHERAGRVTPAGEEERNMTSDDQRARAANRHEYASDQPDATSTSPRSRLRCRTAAYRFGRCVPPCPPGGAWRARVRSDHHPRAGDAGRQHRSGPGAGNASRRSRPARRRGRRARASRCRDEGTRRDTRSVLLLVRAPPLDPGCGVRTGRWPGRPRGGPSGCRTHELRCR